MKGKVTFVACLVLAGWILIRTWPLKTISYDKIPKVGVTFDEYAFGWTGKSLLASGEPVGWSTNLSAYQKDYTNGSLDGFTLGANRPKPAIAVVKYDYGIGDRYIDLVQPYLDHPPLAGIVYSLGIPRDTKSLLDIRIGDFRYVNRYLGLVTAVLIFILGCLMYSPVVGLLALMLYSTVPSLVFSSRLTLAENVVVPLFLAAMILLKIAIKKDRVWLFALSGGVAGLAVLAKFSGISVILAGILLCWHEKIERKKWLIFVITALGVASLFVWYGLYVAPNLFWEIMTSQAGRGNWGVMNLLQAAERVFFQGFPLDGWWTGGFLAFFYIAGNSKHRELFLMGLVYTIVAAVLGGDNNAWYFFPLGIFFCLSFAVLIYELFEKPTVVGVAVLTLFGMMSSFYWGYTKLHPDMNFSWINRFLVGAMITGGIVAEKWVSQKKWVRWVWCLFLIILIHRLYIWNVRSVQYMLLNWGELPYPLMLK